MEIVKDFDLIRILKDLKSKNKTIARFPTTGRLHKGHIEGLKYAKNYCDVLVVSFNDWFRPILCGFTGDSIYLSNSYIDSRKSDIEILESLKFIDFVVEKKNSIDIFEGVKDIYYNIVLKEKELISSYFNHNIFKNNLAMFSLTRIAETIWTPEENIFCDQVWGGDKDAITDLLAEIISKRNNINLKLKFFPTIRDKHNVPFSSESMILSGKFVEYKKDLSNMFLTSVNGIINGTKFGSNDGIINIVDRNSLEKVERLLPGAEYFICGIFGKIVDHRKIRYTDCVRVKG